MMVPMTELMRQGEPPAAFRAATVDGDHRLARRASGEDASAARDGRASLRHDQGSDGGYPLPHEDTATGRQRDGATRTRLQSHPRHEHHRHPDTHHSDEGIVSIRKINAARQLRRPCVASPLGVSTQPRPVADVYEREVRCQSDEDVFEYSSATRREQCRSWPPRASPRDALPAPSLSRGTAFLSVTAHPCFLSRLANGRRNGTVQCRSNGTRGVAEFAA